MIVEGGAVDAGAALHVQLPGAVVERAAMDRQRRQVHLAGYVVERAGRQCDAAAGEDLAAIVVDRAGHMDEARHDRHGRRSAGVGGAAIGAGATPGAACVAAACAAVAARARAGASTTVAGAAIARTIHAIRACGGRRSADLPAAHVMQAGRHHIQRHRSTLQYLARLVIDAAAGAAQRQAGRLDHAVTVLDITLHRQHRAAGAADQIAVAQAGGRQLQAGRAADGAAVRHPRRRVQRQRAAGGDGAAVGHAIPRRGRQSQAGRQAAGIFQPALGGDDQLARRSAQRTGIAHADTSLGADQRDLVGVHAAQLRGIDAVTGRLPAGRHRGRGTAGSRAAGGQGDVVDAGRHIQLLRPQAGVQLHRARDQGRVVGLPRVQARAADADHAAPHRIAAQRAIGVVQQGFAGGQRGAADVDETGAVDHDAGRIGDHQFRARSGHLDIAAQLARIVGVHFVQDHPRAASLQPRIGVDPAAQLALHGGARVVQHGARLGHIEAAVDVARHARRARRLHVDLQHAVGRVEHGGLLAPCRVRIGDDLRRGQPGQQGRPAKRTEQRAGQAAQARRHAALPAARRRPRRARLPSALAAAAGGFLYGHAEASGFVEDDTVAELVHCGSFRRRG